MTVSSVDFPIDLASPDAQAVARLLAAATAPPRPHELRGYEAARRAFERAGTAGATPVRRAGLPLRRMIGVKVAAVAGALTVTGVAVAAEADVLPTPLQRVAHQMLGGVGVPDPDPDPAPSTAPGLASSSSTRPGTPHPTGTTPGGRTGSSGGSLPGTPTGTPTGTGSASAPGSSSAADTDVLTLCRAYTAQEQGGAALSAPDRRRLATLAGGEEKIAGYCARMLAPASPQPSDSAGSNNAPSPSKDHKPTDPSSPGAQPTTPGSPDGGNGNGHGRTPDPTRTPHASKP
ncbi:hypothetical protein [Catenulispora subtropica]